MENKSRLSKELIEKAVKYIEEGNYIETVAAFLGITKRTFYDWIRRGARNSEALEQDAKLDEVEMLYAEFFTEVEKARAVAEMKDLDIIKQASEKRWEAAAWRLERRSPDKYGRRSEVKAEVSHDGGINIIMNIPDTEDDGNANE